MGHASLSGEPHLEESRRDSRLLEELQQVRSSFTKLPLGRKKLRITRFLSSSCPFRQSCPYRLTFLKTESESLRLSLTKLVKNYRSSSVRGRISEYWSSVRVEESKPTDSVSWMCNYYSPLF
jgi:hypothetical protein